MRARSPSAEEEPIWHHLQGSSGWGDAVVLVPWEIYRQYGDEDVLTDVWPNMLRWLDFAAESARTKRFAGRVAVRPSPAPHEQYLWDGGFHWGEWLEPDVGYDDFWQIDQGHVGTAYLHHSCTTRRAVSDVCSAMRMSQIGSTSWRGTHSTRGAPSTSVPTAR